MSSCPPDCLACSVLRRPFRAAVDERAADDLFALARRVHELEAEKREAEAERARIRAHMVRELTRRPDGSDEPGTNSGDDE